MKSTIKASEEARSLMHQHEGLADIVAVGISGLNDMLGEESTIDCDQFQDPYDGQKLLMVSVSASRPYAEISATIDRFVSEFWFQYLESLPVKVIFQANF